MPAESNSPSGDPRASGDDDLDDVLVELAQVNNELVATQRALARRTADLKRRTEELDHTLLQMNQLLGMTAHDLRNPAGAIGTMAQTLLLQEDGQFEPVQITLLERIAATSQRMLRHIDQLVDLSSIEHGVHLNLADIDLVQIVTDAVDLVGQTAASKQITIRLDLPTAVPVHADGDKLGDVVMNLITNAIKYSHRHTETSITVEDLGERVELRVADDGVGIAEDDLDKIFRPFAKASSRPTEDETTTGLGLAIATRIVVAHNGTLTVESTQGHGSTFTVTLPRP